MLLPDSGHSRKGSAGVALVRTALCASILLLILVRVYPPSFPQVLACKSIVKCSVQIEHRQCFDNCGLEWTCAPRVSQLAPPPALNLGVIPEMEPIPTLHLEGFHYNRPPPSS
jgi:hypothetical protein